MNRVVVQEGFAMPYNGYSKKKHRKSSRRRRMSGGMKKQQSKMKACARAWNGKGKYQAHMKRCLSK